MDNEILREQLSVNSFSFTSTAFRIGLLFTAALWAAALKDLCNSQVALIHHCIEGFQGN